jgi:hypothetical protein
MDSEFKMIPSDPGPSTDTPLPSLAKLVNDKLLPRLVNPDTVKCPPSFVKEATDSELPRVTKSTTDIFEPVTARHAEDKLDPNRTARLTLKHDAKEAEPITEMPLNRSAFPVTDNILPPETSPATLNPNVPIRTCCLTERPEVIETPLATDKLLAKFAFEDADKSLPNLPLHCTDSWSPSRATERALSSLPILVVEATDSEDPRRVHCLVEQLLEITNSRSTLVAPIRTIPPHTPHTESPDPTSPKPVTDNADPSITALDLIDSDSPSKPPEITDRPLSRNAPAVTVSVLSNDAAPVPTQSLP